MAEPYPGNTQANVNKDAKYSVVHGSDGFEIRLVFRLSAKEKALLTTARHPELVEMVNAVKVEANGAPGGAFYINEYLDVLVPTTRGGCSLAGAYQRTLEFDLDGQVIGPRPPRGIEPGDAWPGPHVGIRYKLKAGGRDISYARSTSRGEVEHRLSDEHGVESAAALSRRLARFKGDAGGRIYINEASEFFSPPSTPGEPYLYLGGLDDDLWFAPPEIARL